MYVHHNLCVNQVGQTLQVPCANATAVVPPAVTLPAGSCNYTVASGDTFASIAAHYGTTAARMQGLNPGILTISLQV